MDFKKYLEDRIKSVDETYEKELPLIDLGEGHKVIIDYKGTIEKQSKEIEELKAINKMQKYRIEVIDEREFISKDKIKAKVIEIKNRPVKDEFITVTQGKLNTIIDIESLLDEEE